MALGGGVGSAGRLGTVGIELGVATVVGLLAGAWLDARWNTGPWLTLVGVVVGVAAGFRGLVRALAIEEARRVREEERRC